MKVNGKINERHMPFVFFFQKNTFFLLLDTKAKVKVNPEISSLLPTNCMRLVQKNTQCDVCFVAEGLNVCVGNIANLLLKNLQCSQIATSSHRYGR